MFSVTFALFYTGIYTCYGGTHRSDAAQHQVLFRSSQQYHTHSQNLNESSNNHSIPEIRYTSDQRHPPLVTSHRTNEHSFRRYSHYIEYDAAPNPNTLKQNVFEAYKVIRDAQFQNKTSHSDTVLVSSATSPNLAQVSISLTEKLKTKFLPKEPSRQISISRPPVPPARKVPLEPDCDPSDPGTNNFDLNSSAPCFTSKVTKPAPSPYPAHIPTTHAIVVNPEQVPDQDLREQPTTTNPPEVTLPLLFAMVVQPEPGLDQTTTIKPFAGPAYLPPLHGRKVPQEKQPEEDIFPLQRSQSWSNKTKRPCVGPAYLPATKTYKTLKLDDLLGEPRPWWHVGIYTKTTEPFKQICGGSVVRQDVVISAAHCFWADDIGLLPAEDYAVAGNKVYRPWNDFHDHRAQKSDVSEIKVPPRFRGGKTSFQDDLAVVRLATPFRYTSGLRPICVDFDEAFNKQQLKEGNSGVVAGWGYMDEIGTPAQQLLWIELPYVEIEKCIDDAEDTFLKYITSDKICAGEASTSRTLCKGDSGGGLAFWAGEPWDFAPLLRGVGSAAPAADNQECNVHSVPAFTQIASHKSFLLEHVPLLDLDCPFWGLKF